MEEVLELRLLCFDTCLSRLLISWQELCFLGREIRCLQQGESAGLGCFISHGARMLEYLPIIIRKGLLVMICYKQDHSFGLI